MLRYTVTTLLLLCICLPLQANKTEGGTGVLYGEDHAFAFSAPKAWILDNESGVNQGLHMVFYPAGYTWDNSPVAAYGRSMTRSKHSQTIKELVESNVNEFHAQGSPNYRAKKGKTLSVDNGKTMRVYFYQGDQWGNYEAVGYVREKQTINFLVFTARKKRDFDRYFKDYEAMLLSYENILTSRKKSDNADFEELIKEAKIDVSTEAGKAYEKQVVQQFGQTMANNIVQCSQKVGKQEIRDFETLIRIDVSGGVTKTYTRPVTKQSRCFDRLAQESKHPPHQFDTFLLHLDMKIRD